jgi:beta-lactamase regulating signal transducer with metallopeptidase domain
MTRTLLQFGLENGILAALLAIFVALLALLFRGRPALVHGLWLLVLLKLVTPPLVALPLPWPAEVSDPPSAQEQVQTCPFAPDLAAPLLPVLVAQGPGTALQEDPAEPPATDEPSEPSWPALLLASWLAGALACWSVAGLRLLRLCRALPHLAPACEPVQQRIAALQRQLGLRRTIRAFFLPGVMPPMLLAFGATPRLLLPAGLWQRLDDTQRDTLLLHELAHLRRGDHWVRWLELVVLGLYWWHPVAWWASRALHDAEEQCCDAWVVWAAPDAATAYATALVEAIAFLSAAPAALPAGASGAGPVRLIKRRLTMILHRRAPRSLSWPAWAGVLLLGIGLLPLMPTLVRSQPAEPVPAKLEEAKKLLAAEKACLACHEQVNPNRNKDQPMHLHDEVVRLLNERRLLQKRLTETEARLREAMARFEKQQAEKPASAPKKAKEGSEKRLDQLEKSLKRILEEVESLRREIRPAGKRVLNDPAYINQRSFEIPVRYADKKVDHTRLYLSSDGGRSWVQYARLSYPGKSFSFVAPRDGTYTFNIQAMEAGSEPNAILDLRPMQTVVVDTKKPVIDLSVGRSGKNRRLIEWKIADENLDLTTLRVEYQEKGDSEWKALPVEREASGRYLLPADTQPGDVQVSVADLAANKAVRRMQVD